MTPKPFKRPPIVEVEWLDAMGYPGWQHRSELVRACERVDDLDHYSTGYLMQSKRDYVLVACSLARAGGVGDAIQIPRRAIKRITVLRKATDYIESEV